VGGGWIFRRLGAKGVYQIVLSQPGIPIRLKVSHAGNLPEDTLALSQQQYRSPRQ